MGCKKHKTKDMLEMALYPAFGGAAISTVHHSGIEQPYNSLIGTTIGAGVALRTYKKAKKMRWL